MSERLGRAREVVIGSRIKGRGGSVWEITDMAHPAQLTNRSTLWWKAVNVETGEEISLPPRDMMGAVTFVEDGPQPARTAPSDSEQLALLVRELGAIVVATRDHETGEIVCPNHYGLPVDPSAHEDEFLAHLRIAHGLDTSHLRGDHHTQAEVHGQSHNPKFPLIGKGGFPHRHVEDAYHQEMVTWQRSPERQ